MKNKDQLAQEKTEIMQRMNNAVKSGDEDAFAQAFSAFADYLQQQVMREAEDYRQGIDRTILTGRGVRQLTTEETRYFQALADAMRAPNPRQALSEMEVVMPKTTIDAVFDDLIESHPLLSAISFQNTSGLMEFLVNTNGNQLATWSPLCAEITKELASGFKKIDLKHSKLSAFLPVCKAMLDLGPAWLDRYVRTVLQEALYLGLEDAIISGDGKDKPIGMNRQVGDGVTVTGGVYPEKEAVAVSSLDPVSYGALLAGMTKAPNGKTRKVEQVMMLVNPADYLTKVMPATTVKDADGRYINNIFPFPTTVIQSIQVPENRAIFGLPNRYFMGIGTAQSGRIEYSDEYHFLEDERVYIVKLYGSGMPLDNSAFVYADITNLAPAGAAPAAKAARAKEQI